MSSGDTQIGPSARLKRWLLVVIVTFGVANLVIGTWRFWRKAELETLSNRKVQARLEQGEHFGQLPALRKKVLQRYRRECTDIRRIRSMMLLSDGTPEDFPVSAGDAVVAGVFRPVSAQRSKGQPASRDDALRVVVYIPPGQHRICYSYRELFGSEYVRRNSRKTPADRSAALDAWRQNTVTVDVPTGKVYEIVFSVHVKGAEPRLKVTVPGHYEKVHSLRDCDVVYESYRKFYRHIIPNELLGPMDEFNNELWSRGDTFDNEILDYEFTMASRTETENYWNGTILKRRGKRESLSLRAWIESNNRKSASTAFIALHLRRFLQRNGPDAKRWNDPEMSYVMGMFGDLVSGAPLPELDAIFELPTDSGQLYFR